jgi:hypothetical protein
MSLRIVQGFWDELSGRFPHLYGEQLDKIESETEAAIESLLSILSADQLKKLLETIRERRSLVYTNAAYGNEIVSTSKQILAFGGAGIGLVAAFAHNLADLPSALLKLIGIAALFYLDLIALSLITILQFVWLTRFRYPFLYFRRIGNTTPFFYYQAISPKVPRSTFQTAEEKYLAAQLYGEDLIKFIRHLIPEPSDGSAEGDCRSEDRLMRKVVRDELQQYFLLISYQGYVNQYEVRMNNYFLSGLMASIVAVTVVAVCAFLR